MKTIEDLWQGYRLFRHGRYPDAAELYRRLAHQQAPKIMVIACADSRVDPATIFNAAPGELFVVRNVANLVPPYQPDGHYHGTSAAIEFAVRQLLVRHIVVMGHAQCGGIAACLATDKGLPVGEFIAPWVELAAPARDALVARGHGDTPLQTALEHDAIRLSLTNLETFSWIREAIGHGRLGLHGAWFSIEDGVLHWLDGRSDEFRVLSLDEPPEMS